MNKVTPSLCVGLGGTGRDVLMRLRRLIVDRYGSLSSFPIVSFIHIDTDKEGSSTADLKEGSYYRGVDISFKQSEQILATLSKDDVHRFLSNVQDTYYDQRNRTSPYDHILQWFDPKLLKDGQSIEKGAGGIRSVGRLAFFYNFTKINEIINQAKNRILNHQQHMLENWKLDVSTGMNIFVSGSLCGGTGSGMFLDIAYWLRNLHAQDTVVGYFIISPELYGQDQNSSYRPASTYAALMELDYYSRPENRFEAFYSFQNLSRVSTHNPPFDFIYLIGKDTPNQDHTILNKETLCNMIAHKIALDFYSELGVMAQSNKDNVNKYLIKKDLHPQQNCQNYMTFGLAAIYFPHDRIHQITLAKIAQDLLSYWLNGLGNFSSTDQLLNAFFLNHQSVNTEIFLVSDLRKSVLENGKSVQDLINTWKKRQDKLIGDCKSKDDRNRIFTQLSSSFKEQFRKVVFSGSDANRGVWLTSLRRNAHISIEPYKNKINDFLTDLLSCGSSNFGLYAARNWLEGLIFYWDKTRLDLMSKLEEIPAHELNEIDSKIQCCQQNTGDIEKEFLSFNKNSRFQQELRQILKFVENLILDNVDNFTIRESLEVLKQLRQYTQDSFEKLNDLIKQVSILKDYWKTNEDQIRQLKFEMTGEAIFEEEDIIIAYQRLLRPEDQKLELQSSTRKILEELCSPQSFYTLSKNRISLQDLQKCLARSLNQIFSKQNMLGIDSVVSRFLQKYGLDTHTRLAQILRESESRLPLSLNDQYFDSSAEKLSKLIGFNDEETADIKSFRNILENSLGISPTQFHSIQARDEILIVQEYAAFPLRLICGIEEWKTAYQLEKRREMSLHTNCRDIFDHVLPQPWQMFSRIEDQFFPCFAFQKIQNDPNTSEIIMNGNRLSASWRKALITIAENPALQNSLDNIYQGLIREIQSKRNKQETYYSPELQKFREWVDGMDQRNPNLSYKSRILDDSSTIPFRLGILTRFQQTIERGNEGLSESGNSPFLYLPSAEISDVDSDDIIDTSFN